MNNPHQEQTNDKMETENAKISQVDPTLVEAMLRYPAPYANERFAFISGAKWKDQRSYSEQQVIEMLNALRQRCAEEAKVIYINLETIDGIIDIEVDKSSITVIDLHQFIPPLTK